MFYSITHFVVLCGENIRTKLKIFCSVTVSRLVFVAVPIADKTTKLDRKSTMYRVVKCS